MSRGFVKEDDQEEVPMVPRRAFLPEGVTNFVTPNGLNELLADEADISKGKVSFISPIARVLINKKAGDIVSLQQAGKNIIFEIVSISYNQ